MRTLLWIPGLILFSPLCFGIKNMDLSAQHRLAILESYNQEKEGKLDDALESVLKVYNKVTPDYFLNMRLANLFFQTKRYKSAVAYFGSAIKDDTMSVEPKLALIDLYTITGDFEVAVRMGKDVLKKDPGNLIAMQRTSAAMVKLGRYNDAIDLVGPLLLKYPQDPGFLEIMAMCYEKLDFSDKARSLYAKLLLINPSSEPARKFLTK